MSILACNSLLYWFTFIYYYRKDGMCVSTMLWLYYATFSVFGALLMVNDMYFDVMGIPDKAKRLEGLSIEPYVLLYLTFYLFVIPLRRVKMDNLDFSKIGLSHFRLRKLGRICCFFEIIYILIKLYQLYLVSQIGFGVFHDMQKESAGIDAEFFYGGSIGIIIRFLNYIGRFINLVFMPTISMYMIYMFCHKAVSKKEFFWIVGSYFVGKLIVGVVGGSRGMMFFSVMELLIYYFIFKDYVSKNLKRGITRFGLVLCISIILVTLSISIERNDNIGGGNVAVAENILRYLGEMWPNLGLEYWDRVHVHPYGELLYSYLVPSNQDLTVEWFYKTGAHTWWFFTILGRLYFEYSKFLSIVIILFLALIIRKFMSKKTYRLCDMGIIIFIYNFCVGSLFNLTLIDPVTLFSLMALIVLSWILKPKNRYGKTRSLYRNSLHEQLQSTKKLS